jgi:hypothetical protein
LLERRQNEDRGFAVTGFGLAEHIHPKYSLRNAFLLH